MEAETEIVPGASGGRPGVVEGFAAPILAEGSEDFTGVEVGVEVGEGPLDEGRLREVLEFVALAPA